MYLIKFWGVEKRKKTESQEGWGKKSVISTLGSARVLGTLWFCGIRLVDQRGKRI